MAQGEISTQEARRHVGKAAREAHPWIERLARLGYVAKGVVYLAIGFLAVREALGLGGQTTGPGGAIRSVGSVGSQLVGGALLVALAAGLVGYAVWKVVQGVADPDEKGTDAHGLLRRVAYVGSGGIHAVLAFTAAQSVFGANDSSEDAMTASAMAYGPQVGRVLVGAVGLGVISVGLYQLYAAYGARFMDELKIHQMDEKRERFVTLAGRVGTAARALAIGFAGTFVVLAAYQSDPQEVRGLGAALEALQKQPSGSWMLGAVAAGLLVYGAFMLLVARYRHIGSVDPTDQT